MKAVAALLALAFGASPLVAVAVAVSRASVSTVDTAVTLLALGVFALLAGGGSYATLAGAARLRQAKHAAPSHQIDARRQQFDVDARRVVLVNAAGDPVELPQGARFVEVMQ